MMYVYNLAARGLYIFLSGEPHELGAIIMEGGYLRRIVSQRYEHTGACISQ